MEQLLSLFLAWGGWTNTDELFFELLWGFSMFLLFSSCWLPLMTRDELFKSRLFWFWSEYEAWMSEFFWGSPCFQNYFIAWCEPPAFRVLSCRWLVAGFSFYNEFNLPALVFMAPILDLVSSAYLYSLFVSTWLLFDMPCYWISILGKFEGLSTPPMKSLQKSWSWQTVCYPIYDLEL